jgi:hypothetical protein
MSEQCPNRACMYITPSGSELLFHFDPDAEKPPCETETFWERSSGSGMFLCESCAAKRGLVW